MSEISLFEVGLSVIALGLILWVVASITMLIAGFTLHAGWGIGMFCFPPLTLVFVAMHWQHARKPMLRMLAALVLFALGVFATRHAHREGHTGWLHGRVAHLVERWLENVDAEVAAMEAEPAQDEPQRRMLGRQLDDVIAEYGFPRMRMEVGESIFLRYAEWEFQARRDGTVVGVERLEQE